VKRALLFIVGVGVIASALFYIPMNSLPPMEFLVVFFAGCTMLGFSLARGHKRHIESEDEFDAEAQERWRLLEEEQEKQRAKKDTAREERLQKVKSVKDGILANIKRLGFCEIKEDTCSLSEDESVPIGAKVHEVIPVIREIAANQDIEMSYVFVMYSNEDIRTVNIELVFLEEKLTVGPEISL